MVNELSRGVQALAAMAEHTGSVGLGVEVEKESRIGNRQATVKDVERVLELIWASTGKERQIDNKVSAADHWVGRTGTHTEAKTC